MPTTVQTILFDMGNVLIFHDNALLLRRTAERAGVPQDVLEQHLNDGLWRQADVGAISGEELRRGVCRKLGHDIPADEFNALWTCHFAVNEPMVRHVAALVGRVKLVLLSNTNEIHARYCLEQLPILQRFDELLFSHELGLVKPDPEIFRRALARAGTDAEATAFFDDIQSYVDSARALGIRGCLFRNAAEFPDQLRELGL